MYSTLLVFDLQREHPHEIHDEMNGALKNLKAERDMQKRVGFAGNCQQVDGTGREG